MDESRKNICYGGGRGTDTKEYWLHDSTDMYSGYRIGKYVETESYALVVVCGWGVERWEWLPVDIDFLFRVMKMFQLIVVMSTQLCQCAKTAELIVCFSRIMWFVNFISIKLLLKRNLWDFLSCPVVKTLFSQHRGHRFSSWSGNWDPTCHKVWPEKPQNTQPATKNLHKAIVIKTMWGWRKTRYRS